jgi:hypothetical protein
MRETVLAILNRAGRATEISAKQGTPYNLYRGVPTLRPMGSRSCNCGRRISANKTTCKGCADAEV